MAGVGIAPTPKHAASYVPTVNEDGEVVQACLDLMNGERTSEVIAQRLLEQYPDHFSSERAALTLVGRLADQYG